MEDANTAASRLVKKLVTIVFKCIATPTSEQGSSLYIIFLNPMQLLAVLLLPLTSRKGIIAQAHNTIDLVTAFPELWGFWSFGMCCSKKHATGCTHPCQPPCA